MKGESQRWVQAGIVLSNDPSAKVLCPKCQKIHLVIEDIDSDQEENLIERVMKCPECGAWNSMRMKKSK